MGNKCIKVLVSLFVPLLMIACTNSGDSDQINDALSASGVFNESQTSFQNSAEVLAFDEQNRPILSSTKNNCPEDPTEPLECETGFTYEESSHSCVSICKEGQIFAQGQCYERERSCDIENGEGSQSWLANSYGECEPTSCSSGYQITNNSCTAICSEDEVYHDGQCKPLIADCNENGKSGSKVWEGSEYGQCHTAKDCTVDNGTGIQDWLASSQSYDSCKVVSCNNGYKQDGQSCVDRCQSNEIFNGKKCLPLTRSCSIAGGKGEQKWHHRRKRYKRCRVVSCDDGFQRRGNSCVRPRRPGDRECDPLIVDLGSDVNNAQGISLTSQIDGILFDILGLNSLPKAHDKKQISWTQQERYQFVVRPDANGQVTGIEQMFGDNTLGPDGKFSADGFEALSKFDIDKNGSIDPDDPIFFELALWHDANGNGTSDPGELTSFTAAKISSVDLRFDPNFFEVDQYGNKTTYKSVVKFNNGKQSLIFDLWFKYFEPKTEDPNQCPGDNDTGAGNGL